MQIPGKSVSTYSACTFATRIYEFPIPLPYPVKLNKQRSEGVVTLRAYARHRGQTPTSIVQAYQEGRLTDRSVKHDAGQKRWEINIALADAEMDGLSLETVAGKGVAGDADGDSLPMFEGDTSETIPPYSVSKARKEYHLARIAKMEEEELAGKLVRASDVEKEFFKVGREVRNAMEGFPVRIIDEICCIPISDPDRRFKILTLLEKEVNQALLALSDRRGK